MGSSSQSGAGGNAKRAIRFQTFDDVVADVEALRSGGYERLGNWTLEQMCFHMRSPIPQPLKAVSTDSEPVVQQAVIDRFQYYVDHGHPAPGFTAPPGSEPPAQPDAHVIDDFIARLRSADAFDGAYVDLGPRGPIPAGLYKPFLLAHCGHHLGFLLPR